MRLASGVKINFEITSSLPKRKDRCKQTKHCRARFTAYLSLSLTDQRYEQNIFIKSFAMKNERRRIPNLDFSLFFR